MKFFIMGSMMIYLSSFETSDLMVQPYKNINQSEPQFEATVNLLMQSMYAILFQTQVVHTIQQGRAGT